MTFLAKAWKVWGKWHVNFSQGLGKLGGNGKWHFNFGQGLGVGMFWGNGVFENFMINNLQEEEGRIFFLFFFLTPSKP